jgi:phenylpropionate dioxygenase-like ring-hydroxylating dioxygenase large terminal subunit
MFVKNCWYVAAQASELGRELMQRWIIGEPVVLFRSEAGKPAALEDRCPHRRASLSKGTLVGDTVQCGYHGMRFDCAGACVQIPGQEQIPAALSARVYPVVQKWHWIWIWMGEPHLADEALIPDLRYNDTPGWTVTGGVLKVQAHYQLLVDNLLDLTHETFVHSKTIGNKAVAETPMESRVEGNEVHVQRVMRDTPPPPLFKRVRNLTGNIDRWQIIRFQPPCSVSIDARGYPTGSEDPEKGLRWFSINSITPIDERTSNYYWTITRCFAQDDPEITELVHKQILATFLEDVDVLEAQQRLIETDGRGRTEVSVRADFGSIAARRVVQRLIAHETQGAAAMQATRSN